VKALTEFKKAQRTADGRNRRWFDSSDMDLIVWYGEHDSITGFELYYDKNLDEHVFIWDADGGFAHLAVDDGEQKPVFEYKESPILVPDGHVDPNRISELFKDSCSLVPAEIVTLVLEKLAHHPDYRNIP